MKFSTVIWIWVDTCCIFRFINVVFPQPLGPRITVIPLVSRSNEIPLRACTSLFLLWYVFRIFLSFIRHLTDCFYQYNTLLLPQGMLTVKDYLSTKKAERMPVHSAVYSSDYQNYSTSLKASKSSSLVLTLTTFATS